MSERISTARQFAFALGNAGFQLTDRIVVVVAVYFYLPPPGRGLVAQVPEEIFFGIFTVYGLAMLVGRFFDAAADPLVGHGSDRSGSRFGRRRSFLIYGIAPMVGIPLLLFFPPFAAGSVRNGYWLAGLLALYFVFFTIYVGPYLALIPEIAWTQRERISLAKLLAVAAIPIAAVFGAVWPLGLDLGRAAGLAPTDALRVVVVVASLGAFLLCLAPIFAIDERRFARSAPSDLSLWRALVTTLRNRAFLVYLAAQIFFILGLNLVQPLFPYLATVVLGRSEGFAVWFGASALVGFAVSFALLDRLVHRYGPLRVMMLCVGGLGLVLLGLGLLEADVPGGPHDRTNLTVVFSVFACFGFPVAGLMVLPHVLISQLVDRDERATGANRSAMFFGVQGFLTKWAYGASLWIFTVLLSRFGNRPDESLGVILVGPVAGVACLLSLALYAFYPEREVLEGEVESGPLSSTSPRRRAGPPR